MPRIENELDVLRVGVRHHVLDLALSLELVVQMSVNPKRNAYFIKAASAQDLDRLGDVLQIFLSRALRPPPAQIGLLVIASKLLGKADHAQMVFNHITPRRGVFESRTASTRAASDRFELYADLIHPLFQTDGGVRVILRDSRGEDFEVLVAY